MNTALKIGLAAAGAALAYVALSDSLRVGDEVLVSSAAFPGAATTPEVAALVPPGARLAVRVTGVKGSTFTGVLTGFVFTNPQGQQSFTALTGPLVPALPVLDRKGIVGKR